MPQLDKITFLSQFFWLSFFYLGFYFLVYKFFLPKMSRILKFRKTKINTSQEGGYNMGQESDKVGKSYQSVLSTAFTTCKTTFNQNFKEGEEWLNNTVSSANQKKLKNTNQTYISSLGEGSISQRVGVNQAFVKVAEKAFFALLISKFKMSKKANFSTSAIVSIEKSGANQKGKASKSNKAKDSEKNNSAEISETLSRTKTKVHKEQGQVAQKGIAAEGKGKKGNAKSSVNKENKGKNQKKG